jgi:hypothetical protein
MFVKCAVFLLALSQSVLSFGKEKTLTVGYFDIPPYSYTSNEGQAIGAAIEFNNSLFKEKLGYKIIYKRFPFVRVINELKDGNIDAALLLGKNDSRSKMFSYPDNHYIEDYNSIVVRASSALNEIRSHSDLNGLRILYIKKGYRSQFMSQGNLDLQTTVFGENYIEQLLKLVMLERVEAAYLPTEWTFKFQAMISGNVDRLKFLRTPEPAEKFYTVFKKNISPELLAKYNKANQSLISSDVMSDFVERLTLPK